MGEAAGKIYVAKHFPPEAKARMKELVANLIAAYREDIASLDVDEPRNPQASTREARQVQPQDRLSRQVARLLADSKSIAMTWSATCSGRRPSRSTAASTKLGKPVDRDEWGMTPQTVNAYYNPSMNEIVFPAAILQPPFFDMDADDAVNYGAIGAVIGHEIGHGFDDQGSKFDGAGNMVNWWTDPDRKEFEARAKMLIDQYNGFEPAQLPGRKVNGALTIGENIGDLGGLSIAYKAYRRSLQGREAPVLDGLTRRPAVLHRLGPGLAEQVSRRRARAAAGHRSPLAPRVPLQRRPPQPARVLRGLRRQRGRQALARTRETRANLVSKEWRSARRSRLVERIVHGYQLGSVRMTPPGYMPR